MAWLSGAWLRGSGADEFKGLTGDGCCDALSRKWEKVVSQEFGNADHRQRQDMRLGAGFPTVLLTDLARQHQDTRFLFDLIVFGWQVVMIKVGQQLPAGVATTAGSRS